MLCKVIIYSYSRLRKREPLIAKVRTDSSVSLSDDPLQSEFDTDTSRCEQIHIANSHLAKYQCQIQGIQSYMFEPLAHAGANGLKRKDPGVQPPQRSAVCFEW